MKKHKNLIASKQSGRYPLATKSGIEMMIAMLVNDGAMCAKCGYGTNVISKSWAKCKKCGERVARNGT